MHVYSTQYLVRYIETVCRLRVILDSPLSLRKFSMKVFTAGSNNQFLVFASDIGHSHSPLQPEQLLNDGQKSK